MGKPQANGSNKRHAEGKGWATRVWDFRDNGKLWAKLLWIIVPMPFVLFTTGVMAILGTLMVFVNGSSQDGTRAPLPIGWLKRSAHAGVWVGVVVVFCWAVWLVWPQLKASVSALGGAGLLIPQYLYAYLDAWRRDKLWLSVITIMIILLLAGAAEVGWLLVGWLSANL